MRIAKLNTSQLGGTAPAQDDHVFMSSKTDWLAETASSPLAVPTELLLVIFLFLGDHPPTITITPFIHPLPDPPLTPAEGDNPVTLWPGRWSDPINTVHHSVVACGVGPSLLVTVVGARDLWHVVVGFCGDSIYRTNSDTYLCESEVVGKDCLPLVICDTGYVFHYSNGWLAIRLAFLCFWYYIFSSDKQN